MWWVVTETIICVQLIRVGLLFIEWPWSTVSSGQEWWWCISWNIYCCSTELWSSISVYSWWNKISLLFFFLLQVTVWFIKKRVWDKCSDELKQKMYDRHKILGIIDNLTSCGIYSQDIRVVSLFQVYVVQHKRFSDVFRGIVKKQRNGLQKELDLTPNEFGILMCHGRFLTAEMSEDAKYPKLLPWREHFTRLVIKEIHERLTHAGISHTLSTLQQEYWLPQVSAEVRACLFHCLVCRRHEGPSFTTKNATMAQAKSIWIFTFSIHLAGLLGTSICERRSWGDKDVDLFIHLPCYWCDSPGMGQKSFWWTLFTRFRGRP